MATPRSVVVLDDDPDLRDEICAALAADGHAVVGAGDAGVLRTPAFKKADVILLDLSMPGVDGIDVLHDLARLPAPPLVILMSGHGEPVLRTVSRSAESEGLTILGVLPKPIDPDRLNALLNIEAVTAAHASGPAIADVAPALASALDAGSLSVHFQPKVHAGTLAFAGAEALLAGDLGGGCTASPPTIVEAARAVPGALVRLTHNVLRQAAHGCATWTAAGFSGPVSVNLPIEALLDPDAVATLTRITRSAGIAPSQVTFELLEDSLYDSSAGALAILAKLRLAGFGLALDDVGQRQSGLLQLANLAVTEIKIDLEIVRQARVWEKARGIFGSLAGLGHRLGVAVTAEGVETASDLAFVRAHPVDYVQGYLISRKRPLSDMLRHLPVRLPGLAEPDVA